MNTTDAARTPPITVVVVDDQAVVRSGLRMILDAQDGIVGIGEAGNGEDAIELVVATRPDVVLMDIRMPVLDGITATQRLAERGVTSRILVLTTYAIDENVYDALRAGASGFFAKTDDPEVIVAAVRAATAADRQIGPSTMQLLVERFLATAPTTTAIRRRPRELELLTDREREVLLLVGRGRANGEIAAELFIGEATVKTHLTRVMTKLNLRDRVHAVVFCYEHGLLTPGR
jgi:DNA-binding NarL/FixJ family response regulator